MKPIVSTILTSLLVFGNFILTKRCCQAANSPALYSAGPGFESRCRDRIFWLDFSWFTL